MGEMWIDGVFQCYTLEPARVNPVNPGHPCISAGTFKVVLTKSPHLGYVTPEVLDVPGRTAIRWHIANFPKDMLGCTAVGTMKAVDAVWNSAVAFHRMMDKLALADSITVTYTDPVTA